MKPIYVIVWRDREQGEFGLVQAYTRFEDAEADFKILLEENRGARSYELEVVDWDQGEKR